MKAAYITKTGPASEIQYGDIDEPKVGPTDVLVEMKAVAVNPIDTYLRSGVIEMDLPMPFIIGCDIAGEVVAIGDKVKRFQVGDRVWGSNQGLLGRQGTFAERCAIDECWLYPTPASLSDESAAASALVGITAHLGLFHRAQLQTGETVFVRGGSGGVGSMVIQMAKAVGARVIATAGSKEKVERCRKHGADIAINYQDSDPVAEAHKHVAGVDVWWDTVRTPDFDGAMTLLNDNGRMVVMAGRDARPEFPVGPFYVKQCTILGFVMFKASPEQQREAAEGLNRWLTEGKVQSVISERLPLAKAAKAHALQENATLEGKGDLAGKIVLTP